MCKLPKQSIKRKFATALVPLLPSSRYHENHMKDGKYPYE